VQWLVLRESAALLFGLTAADPGSIAIALAIAAGDFFLDRPPFCLYSLS